MNFTTRQIEILEVSMKLISSNGIQQLTTKNIAIAMGFTEPSIYRHFKNKSAILEAILTYYKEQMKFQMEKVFQPTISPLEKLRQMVSIQFEYFARNPALSLVIFSDSIFQHEEHLAKTVKNMIENKLKFTEKIILEGQNKGIIRTDLKANDLATMYIGCIRFTLLKWKISNYHFDLINEIKIVNNLITKLLS